MFCRNILVRTLLSKTFIRFSKCLWIFFAEERFCAGSNGFTVLIPVLRLLTLKSSLLMVYGCFVHVFMLKNRWHVWKSGCILILLVIAGTKICDTIRKALGSTFGFITVMRQGRHEDTSRGPNPHFQEWPISHFSCSLTRNITSHSMKHLPYSDEWWLYYQFSLPHLQYTCLFRRLGECTFWTWEWKGIPTHIPHRNDHHCSHKGKIHKSLLPPFHLTLHVLAY